MRADVLADYPKSMHLEFSFDSNVAITVAGFGLHCDMAAGEGAGRSLTQLSEGDNGPRDRFAWLQRGSVRLKFADSKTGRLTKRRPLQGALNVEAHAHVTAAGLVKIGEFV